MKRKDFIRLSAASGVWSAMGFVSRASALPSNKQTPSGSLILCSTCGTQFNRSTMPAAICPVCADDRQYLPPKGQSWTQPEELQNKYSNSIKEVNEHFYEIKTTPKFAIGQRAFLIITPGGNILWDCISLLNEPTREFIRSKGGLKAIVISHPHYYTTMNDWAAAFDCPVYLHEADETFIYEKGPKINLWSGDRKELWDGIRAIHIGGHFPGSSILQVPFLSSQSALLCGDTFYIAPSKRHVSVMYSYPNMIPVTLAEISRIRQTMQEVKFDRMIGAFDNQSIESNAKEVLLESLGRYR
jgi:hypothetical protein